MQETVNTLGFHVETHRQRETGARTHTDLSVLVLEHVGQRRFDHFHHVECVLLWAIKQTGIIVKSTSILNTKGRYHDYKFP